MLEDNSSSLALSLFRSFEVFAGVQFSSRKKLRRGLAAVWVSLVNHGPIDPADAGMPILLILLENALHF